MTWLCCLLRQLQTVIYVVTDNIEDKDGMVRFTHKFYSRLVVSRLERQKNRGNERRGLPKLQCVPKATSS